MGLAGNILSRFGYHRGVPITFMSYTGDCDTKPFFINLDEFSGIRKAYCKCSPISTVVNRLASSMANGKWWVVDDNNNDVSKRFRNIYDLIQSPNPLQSLTEFVKQVDLYRNLYGVSYVYAVVPDGFGVEDAVSLWPVNPERIEAVYRRDISLYNARNISEIIEKYVITIENSKIDVIPEHVLCIKDTGLDVIKKINSRVEGLEYEIKNICQAQEAVYSLNKDRGALGILVNKSRDSSGYVPVTPEEKEHIEKRYQERYGLNERQQKIVITNADLQWIQMSFNVKDLMLFEGIKQNIERVCDAFNYPFELISNEKGTTFTNKPESEKYLYQDNIIPNSKIYAEKFTKFFGLVNAKIDIDFSDVEYLKQAEKEKAEAKLKMNQALQIPYRLGVITMEEYREMLDLDEKPNGKIFYIENNGSEGQTASEQSANQQSGNGQD